MILVLIAGLLSAILAWVGNGWIVKKWDEFGVTYIVPIFEEGLKSGLALLFQASIFYSHVVFGVLEAILDIRSGPNGFRAGIFSLITHSVFGAVTVAVGQLTNQIFLGIIASGIVHVLWNRYIIQLSRKEKNRIV